MGAERSSSARGGHAVTCSRAGRTAAIVVLVLGVAFGAAGAGSAFGFGFITKWRFHATANGVATDRAGNVYITAGRNEVQKFTSRGALITRWKLRTRSGLVGQPAGIATDRAGNVYVADQGNRRIEKFTNRGKLVTEWSVGNGPVAVSVPSPIATDRAGDVYVAFGGTDSIEKFTSNGRFLLRFGSSGVAAGQLTQPAGIAIDDAGNVYVSAAGRAQRVNVFTSDGTFLRAWGSNVGGPGVDVCTVFCTGAVQTTPEALEFPFGVAVDPAGRIFVADSGIHDVKIYSSAGTYLGRFGGYGRGNGRFRYSPTGLAFGPEGGLYVLEFRRVQKFGEPSNAFDIGGAKLDRRRGTARLIANVAGVGRLVATGPGIVTARRRANGAGKASLPVVARRAAAKKLARTGRAVVRIEVTYTPTTAGSASPATRVKHVTLVKRR